MCGSSSSEKARWSRSRASPNGTSVTRFEGLFGALIGCGRFSRGSVERACPVLICATSVDAANWRRGHFASAASRPRELLELLGLARLCEDLGHRGPDLLLDLLAQTSVFAVHFATSRNVASISGELSIDREYVAPRSGGSRIVTGSPRIRITGSSCRTRVTSTDHRLFHNADSVASLCARI
jgi:hypothetical protein